MANNTAPFRKQVPSWLRTVVGLAILITIMLLNGAYTGSSVELSSAFGVMSEDINMAYYAASAGMAIGYPLTAVIRPIITTKTILLSDLILQVGLAFICAKTQSIGVIIAASFLIGFLKAFMLMEMIIIFQPIFSKKNVRSEFYAYFYPIVFGMGQVSMILTAELAYNYQWQYMYYLVIIMLLLSIILVLTCFRYGRKPIHIPIKEIDWVSVLAMSTAFLLILYVCIYGKTKDWFDSSDIVVSTLLIVPLIWFFIHRQKHLKKPYVNTSIITQKKPIIGYIYMAIVMILCASSTLISSYTNSVLRLDNIHSNGLSLMMIPGFILGGIICHWWFKLQIWRFRVLIFWGMACFTAHFAILYFGITPDGSYEFLFLPTLLKGMGMIILFISFGVFAVEDIERPLMISNAFFMVGIRSTIAPVVGASLFSNLLYRLQQKSIMVLSDNIDMQHTLSSSQYNDALSSALKQGMSMSEAQQTAINSLYTTTSVQALLLSIKIILGYLLIFSIIVMVISRFIPFHKTLKVEVVRSGDDMA